MEEQIVLDIKTVDDIEKVKTAILNHQKFTLGIVEPLQYKIVLDGGRFKDYDTSYIDANVARIILANQINYTKLLNQLEIKFGIKFKKEDKLLKFKLQKGSLEFISEIFNVLEVLKEMESQDIMYTVLGLAGMWFSHSAYSKSIEKDIKSAEDAKVVKLKELEGTEKEEYAKMVDKTLDTLKDVMQDKKLQDAINYPKKEALSLLEDNETLNIDGTRLSHKEAESFEYTKPHIEDIEEEAEYGTYTIESYNFHKDGKLFKLVGVTEMANSEVITPLQRMKLITKAENKEEVVLKVKFTKDGVSKKIKSVYIVDVKFD